MNAPTHPTALIADDEPLLAADLRGRLVDAWPGLDVVATVGDGAAAVDEALRRRPALCFLDIRMPGLSGLDAAQAIAEDWPDGNDAPPLPLVVFVTAYEQHALAAFDAQACDYLVKPVDDARLAACVARLKRRLAERAPGAAEQAMAQLRALVAAASPAPSEPCEPSEPLHAIQAADAAGVVHFVPLADVVVFEAADKYVRVLTASREWLIRTPLRELLPRLDARVFWQVHRGTVVRAAAIARAERDEAGRTTLALHGRADRLVVSRLHAHRFKAM